METTYKSLSWLSFINLWAQSAVVIVHSALLLIDPVRNFNEKLDLASMEPSVVQIRAVSVGKKRKGRNQVTKSEGQHKEG